jgi:hypothetical protein
MQNAWEAAGGPKGKANAAGKPDADTAAITAKVWFHLQSWRMIWLLPA